MAKIGYARVSSKDQNLARQEKRLTEEGVEKIFSDKLSGKDRERPELKKVLDYLRAGDTLYVTEMARLARSTKDLHNIVGELKEKGVEIVFLKEQIDTNTPTGKLMFTVLSAIAEFERDIIRERQKEGIEIAKEQGKFKGRPTRELSPEDMEKVKEWHDGTITAVACSKAIGLSRAQLYKRFPKD